MSLDKSIRSGKERRNEYRGAKAVDSTCRNHGSCSWCKGNRTHKNDKRQVAADQRAEEWNTQFNDELQAVTDQGGDQD